MVRRWQPEHQSVVGRVVKEPVPVLPDLCEGSSRWFVKEALSAFKVFLGVLELRNSAPCFFQCATAFSTAVWVFVELQSGVFAAVVLAAGVVIPERSISCANPCSTTLVVSGAHPCDLNDLASCVI